MGPRYNVIGYNGHQYNSQDFYVPMRPFSIVFYGFYLIKTDLQYNSQNAEVPMGPKQPGPTVYSFVARTIISMDISYVPLKS